MSGRKRKTGVASPGARGAGRASRGSSFAGKYSRGSGGLYGSGGVSCHAVLYLLLLSVMISCAPVTLYSVDLKYKPSKTAEVRAVGLNENAAPLVLDEFVDVRQVPDKLVIGAVVKDDGSRIRIFPKYAKPADAVTATVKDYLSHAGYAVIPSAGAAVDQRAKARNDSAKIVVGGEINELGITCQESLTVKKYSSRVKLTVHLADAKTGSLLYKVSAESGSTLEHYRFSEEMLAGQISDALSDAVEKIFGGEEMGRRLRGVTATSR